MDTAMRRPLALLALLIATSPAHAGYLELDVDLNSSVTLGSDGSLSGNLAISKITQDFTTVILPDANASSFFNMGPVLYTLPPVAGDYPHDGYQYDKGGFIGLMGTIPGSIAPQELLVGDLGESGLANRYGSFLFIQVGLVGSLSQPFADLFTVPRALEDGNLTLEFTVDDAGATHLVLGRIELFTQTQVPEPTSLAMLLGGLGLVTAIRRHRG